MPQRLMAQALISVMTDRSAGRRGRITKGRSGCLRIGNTDVSSRVTTLGVEMDRRQLCAVGALTLMGCASPSTHPPADAVAELGGTSRLRAAINFGNPILASRGTDGEPRGVSVDLAREAARRLGLPIELVPFNSAGAVVEAVKAR